MGSGIAEKSKKAKSSLNDYLELLEVKYIITQQCLILNTVINILVMAELFNLRPTICDWDAPESTVQFSHAL
jgi:hypothetical protein